MRTGLGVLAAAAERGQGYRQIRRALIALGAFALSATLGLLALVGVAASDRAAGYLATTPVKTQADRAQALVRSETFGDVGQEQVTVISVLPMRAVAAPPPGVKKWPEPGHAVVSPRLADLLAREGRREHFGVVDGTIANNGLVAPSELRAYIRPIDGVAEPDAMEPIAGWGGPGEHVALNVVATLSPTPTRDVAMLILGSLGLASLAALAMGRRIGARVRDRGEERFRALGASTIQLARMRAANLAGVVLCGAFAGVCLVAGLATLHLPVPFLDHVTGLRSPSALLLRLPMVGLAAAVLALLAVACPSPLARRRATVAECAEPVPTTWAGLFFVGLLMAAFGPAFLSSGPARTLAFVLGSAVATACLPAVVATVTAALGGPGAAVGRRLGDAGMLAGGRHLQYHARSTLRVVAPATLVLLLAGQTQLWTSQLGEQYRTAATAQAVVGGRVAETSVLPNPAAEARFLTALPDGVGHGWAMVTPPSDGAPGRTTVTADCATLRSMGFPCARSATAPHRMTTPSQRTALDYLAAGGVIRGVVGSGRPKVQGGIEPRLLLASTTGAPLDIGQLSDLSYRTVQGGLGVAPLAQSWVGGGYSSAQRGQWVLAFGLAALGLVLIAGWATLGAEALSRARSLRVMTALYGTSGWAASYAFVNVALPLLVATASGVATYLLLPIGFSLTSNVMQPSLAYAAVSFAASLLAGVLTAAITARAVYQPIAPGAEVTSD